MHHKHLIDAGRPRPATPPPYSPALRAGDTVYVSGQIPVDPATGKVMGTTIEEQAAIVLDRLRSLLAAAGAGLDDCVKVTVYLSDLAEWGRFNKVYATYFHVPYPCRSAVQAGLFPGVKVELDAIAVSPPDVGVERTSGRKARRPEKRTATGSAAASGSGSNPSAAPSSMKRQAGSDPDTDIDPHADGKTGATRQPERTGDSQ